MVYEKDSVFYKLFLNLEVANILDEGRLHNIPLYTSLVEPKKKTLIDLLRYILSRHSLNYYTLMLQIFLFFSKSAADPEYFFLIVDLFTSKIYTYHIKSNTLLAKKLEIFYQNIEAKRKQVSSEDKMRMQTDLEFKQTKKKILTKSML